MRMRPRKNLGHRDEIEIYYLPSHAPRREQEFPLSDLGFGDENENSKSCNFQAIRLEQPHYFESQIV